MKQDHIRSGKRESANLSVDSGIVAHAREASLDLPQASEEALRTAAKTAEASQWREDNREWIAASNAWVEDNGLPLDGLRLF